MRGALSILLPILLNVILGYALVATKEYHTSGEEALPQNVLIPTVLVELSNVPHILLQVVDGVKTVGVAQPLLVGAVAGSVIQILYCHAACVPVTAIPEKTRIK